MLHVFFPFESGRQHQAINYNCCLDSVAGPATPAVQDRVSPPTKSNQIKSFICSAAQK